MKGSVVMSEEEKKLYDALFPNDNNPNHINYAYFKGGTKRSLSILKSKIQNSPIGPVLSEDEKNEGAFFIRVFEKDVDTFLNMIKSSKYSQIKIPNRYIRQVRHLFGDN